MSQTKRALAPLVDLVTMDLIQAAILSHLKNPVRKTTATKSSGALSTDSSEPSDSNGASALPDNDDDYCAGDERLSDMSW